MRIINITEPEKSSDFVFRDILFEAGVKDHDVVTASPLSLQKAIKSAEQTDLIVVEAHRNFEFTKKMVEHIQTQYPSQPLFVLYHVEAEPSDPAARDEVRNAFKLMGVDGFADGHDDVGFSATQIIRAIGVEPDFSLELTDLANVHLGDIRFNVLERKAYSLREARHYDDQDLHDFEEMAHATHRLMFKARRGKPTLGENFQSRSAQPPIFEMSAEEAKFIDILGRVQGDAVSRNDMRRIMYQGVFVPEVSVIDNAHQSQMRKIADHANNADHFIIYDPQNDAYTLNDHEFSLSPYPTPEEPYEDVFNAERELFGDTDPEAELYGPHKDPEDDFGYDPD